MHFGCAVIAFLILAHHLGAGVSIFTASASTGLSDFFFIKRGSFFYEKVHIFMIFIIFLKVKDPWFLEIHHFFKVKDPWLRLINYKIYHI